MNSKSADRRSREKLALKQTILSAARDILVSEGYEAISIRAIADRIEYSPASIYLHYQDKDALLLALCEEGFETLNSYLLAAPTPVVTEQMAAMGDAYLKFAIQHPRHYELMFLARSPEVQHALKERCQNAPACFQTLIASLGRAQAQGWVRDDQPLIVLAYTVWGLLHGIASIVLTEQYIYLEEEDVPLVLQHSVRNILRGISPVTVS